MAEPNQSTLQSLLATSAADLQACSNDIGARTTQMGHR